MSGPQDRGRLLEDFLNRLFSLFQIRSVGPFKRNAGGEQIDGAFEWGSWHFLVECKWEKKLSDARELDSLYGKLGRSGSGTMGMFMSINGWSEHVPGLLRQNREKNIILADGYDLRMPLETGVSFREVIGQKVQALRMDAKPFFVRRETGRW